MTDPGQEREALEELVRVKDLEEAMGALPIEYNRMKAAAWEKARVALAAREEPPKGMSWVLVEVAPGQIAVWPERSPQGQAALKGEIGRASCRERGETSG